MPLLCKGESDGLTDESGGTEDKDFHDGVVVFVDFRFLGEKRL